MISFLIATVSSKVIVDSILAGAGLGMAVFKTAKAVSGGNSRRKR